MRSPERKFLYFAVFASGMTTLAVELTAGRLLGNIFGTSNLVWASIIGLILIYLTAGYFLGGWWADRSPQLRTMYLLMAWGAFLIGLVPLVANPVLRSAANAFDQLEIGILLGAFTGVLVLFSIPITLLGTVSPFAIRLAIRTPEEAGRVSGRVYAISTLGSFVGTFLPVLILIPTIGTTMTFIFFSIILILVAMIGLWISYGWLSALKWAWMPIAIILLLVLGLGRGVKSTHGQIFETESQYNYIQVLQDGSYRYLRLNEGQGVHSAYHPTELNYYGPWKQFLVAPFFNQPPVSTNDVQSIAIVGLAAGTTARQATEVFGPIPIDGFEIDDQIINVGRQFFDMNQPNLNAIAQDGRWGLEHSQGRYDLIVLDAYRPPYIPWHLATREYFQIVHDRLTDEGAVGINVGRAPGDRRLIDALVVTLKEVFPSVYVMDVPETFNSIIYATKQPTNEENLFVNLFELTENPDVHPLLIEAMKVTALNMQPVPESGVIFTDDLAPIEWITNNMVLRFMLFGDMEILQ
ncbi:MAG: spermidine synthase [Anaerolineales bacterium]